MPFISARSKIECGKTHPEHSPGAGKNRRPLIGGPRKSEANGGPKDPPTQVKVGDSGLTNLVLIMIDKYCALYFVTSLYI